MKKKILPFLLAFIIFFCSLGQSSATANEIIGSYETPILDKSPNRVTNIKLAAEKIHQFILQPGEIFSFNKVVGKRTEERGFKIASIFENGKVVQGLGGGICQLSSTLYQTALDANLPVTEVHRHSLKVNYIPPGLDAAVSWGAKDLKFQNSLENPIVISAEVTADQVRTIIYKADEEKTVNLYYNENLLEIQPTAYTFKGVTYVPLRSLISSLGYSLRWDEQDAKIIVEAGESIIIFEPHSPTAIVNDIPVPLSHPLRYNNGVTFIPLRFIADSLSWQINWSAENNSVYIVI
ncbi:MAG: VanW family protein [Zhaonellaceae bacterium]|nr:hypothetical protein [Clostridia bacterium]